MLQLFLIVRNFAGVLLCQLAYVLGPDEHSKLVKVFDPALFRLLSVRVDLPFLGNQRQIETETDLTVYDQVLGFRFLFLDMCGNRHYVRCMPSDSERLFLS